MENKKRTVKFLASLCVSVGAFGNQNTSKPLFENPKVEYINN